MDIPTFFENEVPHLLAARPEVAEQVNALLLVEIAGQNGGTWSIDLRQGSRPSVAPGEHPDAKVRIRIPAVDFAELMDGRQRWTDAFVRGTVDIQGDLITAIKLRRLFVATAM
jgi:hypothetical protein